MFVLLFTKTANQKCPNIKLKGKSLLFREHIPENDLPSSLFSPPPQHTHTHTGTHAGASALAHTHTHTRDEHDVKVAGLTRRHSTSGSLIIYSFFCACRRSTLCCHKHLAKKKPTDGTLCTNAVTEAETATFEAGAVSHAGLKLIFLFAATHLAAVQNSPSCLCFCFVSLLHPVGKAGVLRLVSY